MEKGNTSLLMGLTEGLFATIPMKLGKVIAKAAKSWPWYWILGTFLLLGMLSVASFLFAEHARVLDHVASYRDLEWLIPLLYAEYLLMTAPFFFLFAGVKHLKLAGGSAHEKKMYKFTLRKMEKARKAASIDRVFLGISKWSKQWVYLHDEMRKMHCHVVGSTGSGKTDSVILPLFVQDIERGRGAVVMDAKGDLETFNKIHYPVKRVGREKDFLFFSLAYPQKSNTYNPLLRGNPTELKDKIISSNIWTEEYYKSKAEETLLLLIQSLKEVHEIVTFHKLYELVSSENKLRELAQRIKNPELQEIMLSILKKYSSFQNEHAGLKAALGMIARGEFALLVKDEKPQIDLLDAYQNKKIVYFQLNTQGYEETAKRFGRIILQDLKTTSNYVQAYMPERERSFFPIFVDEFSNFAYEPFIEFLNKARGAHMAITIAHQSLGDLQKAGNHFVKQVLENCNIKIIMRQDDPQSIETYSRISGTQRTYKDTVQMHEDDPTGMVSVRATEEFRLKPNTIRALGRGDAAIIMKQPFVIDVFQLDYVGEIPQEAHTD